MKPGAKIFGITKMCSTVIFVLTSAISSSQASNASEIDEVREALATEQVMMTVGGNTTYIFADLTKTSLLWIPFVEPGAGYTFSNIGFPTEGGHSMKSSIVVFENGNNTAIYLGPAKPMSLSTLLSEDQKLKALIDLASETCPVYVGFDRSNGTVVRSVNSCLISISGGPR